MVRAVSIMGYLGMVGGLIGLLVLRSVLSTSPLVLVPQAAAVALMVWARFTFGRRSFHLAANPTEGGLVTTGPYRFVRHPIYAAVCLFVTAGAAAHLSGANLGLLAVVWTGAVARILCEERSLLQQYPDYPQYAARTPRLIPFLF